MPGTVRNITITGNANGGIIAAGGSLTVINSTISNNVSALGGGIQAEASNGVGNTLTVINSTFYGNIETDGGGGDIANLNNDNGPVAAPPVLIQNSILLDGCDNLFQGTYTDGGGNIDGGAIGAGRFGAGTNCIADTAHGSLFTVSAASVIGSALEGGLYFPLANGSPAIGLGTNCPTRDELGNPRNAASCTAGAIELNTPPHSVPALTPAAVALSALLLGAIGWGAVRRA
jgi:hypothetical protein